MNWHEKKVTKNRTVKTLIDIRDNKISIAHGLNILGDLFSKYKRNNFEKREILKFVEDINNQQLTLLYEAVFSL